MRVSVVAAPGGRVCVCRTSFQLVRNTGRRLSEIKTRSTALCVLLCLALPAAGQDGDAETDDALPKLSEMQLPPAEELLTRRPRDWVVLQNDDVAEVESLTPRPDTLELLEEKQSRAGRREGEYAGWDRERARAEVQKLDFLDVKIPDEDLDEVRFRIERKKIARIVHHEDLMLRRAEAAADAGDLRTAFEVLFALKRSPASVSLPDEWPGLNALLDRVSLQDAREQAGRGEEEAALAKLESLHDRVPGLDGLDDALAATAGALVAAGDAAGDPRRARFYLARLARRLPDHPATQGWTGKFRDRAAALRDEAEATSRDGDDRAAARLIADAAEQWPALDGLPTVFRRLTNRHQVLRVATLRLAAVPDGGRPTRFPPDRADERERFLTVAELFELDRVNETPHYRSRFFEQWEPTDLGRRASFTLRSTFPPDVPLTAPTAAAVLNSLRGRLTPGSPLYDERFADVVAELDVRSPTEFEVVFARNPLRTESLLNVPVAVERGDGVEILTRPFERTADDADAPGRDDVAVYRRAVPEAGAASDRHVAEVRETAYPGYAAAVRALLQNEADYLTHVRPWDVPRFRADEAYTPHRAAVPDTHLLQVNPRSVPLKNAELRRALLMAVDRGEILEDVVLRPFPLPGKSKSDPAVARRLAEIRSLGRVVSGPFPSGSDAYNPLLAPRPQELTIAFALALAAKRALGGADGADLPELVLVAPPDEVIREVVDRITATYARIGIRVRVVHDTSPEASDPGGWDLAYRTVRMRDPARELGPFLTLTDSVSLESLLDLSDWLRGDLLALERAGDRVAAVSLLHDLHRHLRAEAVLIPLFEVDGYSVSRDSVVGAADTLVHPYQGVEGWSVRTDPPGGF